MTRLSVNINKIATLRNSRGENTPDLLRFAQNCEKYGAQGITVHPRPDERHIKRIDVFQLKETVRVEFNIEGYPSEGFLDLVMRVVPDQVTLVPDSPEQLTSDSGWDVAKHQDFLHPILRRLRQAGIRSSLFVDPDPMQVRKAAEIGADRVELYTKSYADNYSHNREEAVRPFIAASEEALRAGIGLNAGHDLNLQNLTYLRERLPLLDEVSIGHALISDCLYLGLSKTIRLYRECLR